MSQFDMLLLLIAVWALLWVYSRLVALEWCRNMAEQDQTARDIAVEQELVAQEQQYEELVASNDTSVEESFEERS